MKRSFSIAALVFALDRAAKMLWHSADFTVIPGILGIRGTQNTGMAFGLLGDHPYLLAILALAILILLFLYLVRKHLPVYAQIGFGLVLGGAAGNLFDRLVYGYVIDMLEPLFMHLFIFNPADAAVVCGIFLLGFYYLFGKEHPDEPA